MWYNASEPLCPTGAGDSEPMGYENDNDFDGDYNDFVDEFYGVGNTSDLSWDEAWNEAFHDEWDEEDGYDDDDFQTA